MRKSAIVVVAGIKVRMLWVLAAALVSFFVIQVPAANADTIEYQVTGVGPDLGTNFTFISTTGFLTASDFPIVPTTATDLFVGGIDEGAISSIILTGGGKQLEFIAAGGTFVLINKASGPIIFPTSTGTFTDFDDVLGTETGIVVVTDLSVTAPEPGSVSLLLVGLGSLGLMMVMRKRIS